MAEENQDYTQWMCEALLLAGHAKAAGDVPVGAIVVDREGRVIGRGWNRREVDQNPLGHAELMALEEAAKTRGSWRLDDCSLVVTLEPCVMCAGALVQARIETLIFGAKDEKGGAALSLYAVPSDPRLNHRARVVSGVMEKECRSVLQEFFRGVREN
jgi:tRNA(adenine34) deaminase